MDPVISCAVKRASTATRAGKTRGFIVTLPARSDPHQYTYAGVQASLHQVTVFFNELLIFGEYGDTREFHSAGGPYYTKINRPVGPVRNGSAGDSPVTGASR